MATKRLGKGLEALIRSNSPEISEASAKSSGISSVSITKINTNPLQPRKEFKKELKYWGTPALSLISLSSLSSCL